MGQSSRTLVTQLLEEQFFTLGAQDKVVRFRLSLDQSVRALIIRVSLVTRVSSLIVREAADAELLRQWHGLHLVLIGLLLLKLLLPSQRDSLRADQIESVEFFPGQDYFLGIFHGKRIIFILLGQIVQLCHFRSCRTGSKLFADSEAV